MSKHDIELELSLEKRYASLENLANSKLANFKIATGLMLSLEERMNLDKDKIEKNTFTYSDLMVSKESLDTIRDMAGFKEDQKISVESYLNKDLRVSIEELEAEKRSLADRFTKAISNQLGSLTDIFKNLKAVGDLLRDIKNSKLAGLIQEYDDKKIEFKGGVISNSHINEELAIYFEMHNEFTVSDFSNFISSISNLILKGNLIKEIEKFGYDNVIVSKDNEMTIPANKASLEFVNKIKSQAIRRWLSKDTKWAIPNTITGSSLTILSISQNDEDGSISRFDHFSIEDSVYENKKVEIKSKQDFDKLIQTGRTVIADSQKINSELKSLSLDTIIKDIRSQLATVFYYVVANVFVLRRLFRQIDARYTFLTGALQTSIRLNKAQLDAADLVYSILKNSAK